MGSDIFCSWFWLSPQGKQDSSLVTWIILRTLKIVVFCSYVGELERVKVLFPSGLSAKESVTMDLTEVVKPRGRSSKSGETAWPAQSFRFSLLGTAEHVRTPMILVKLSGFGHSPTDRHSSRDCRPQHVYRRPETKPAKEELVSTCHTSQCNSDLNMTLAKGRQQRAHSPWPWEGTTSNCKQGFHFTTTHPLGTGPRWQNIAHLLLVCGHFQKYHGLGLNEQPQGERQLYLIISSPCLIKFAFIWFLLLVVPTMTS